jgi:hypothetical protein
MQATRCFCRSEDDKPEPFTLEDLVKPHRDLRDELWASETEPKKLASFALGIDPGSQIRQKVSVELPPTELSFNCFGSFWSGTTATRSLFTSLNSMMVSLHEGSK